MILCIFSCQRTKKKNSMYFLKQKGQKKSKILKRGSYWPNFGVHGLIGLSHGLNTTFRKSF